MKVSKEFMSFLEVVKKEFKCKNTDSVLAYIGFDHSGVYYTNLGVGYNNIQKKIKIEIDHEFNVGLDFLGLYKILKLWAKKDCEIVKIEDNYFVQTGTKKVKILSMDITKISEFTIPLPIDLTDVSENIEPFFNCMNFVSTDETRYFMNGVFFDNENIVATDGRLAKIIESNVKDLNNVNIIVPVLKAIKKNDVVYMAVSDDNKNIVFRNTEGVYYISATLAGQFPNYPRVIPEMSTFNDVMENSKELQDTFLEASKMLKAYGSDSNRINIQKDIIFTENELFINEVNTLNVEDNLTFCFNAVYLYELFSSIPLGLCRCTPLNEDQINRGFGVQSEDKKQLFVVMPMQSDN